MAAAPGPHPGSSGSGGAPPGAIVVGIDGRDEDATALEWAAMEAQLRGVPLHLISSLDLDTPTLTGLDAIPMDVVTDAVDEQTAGLLNAARERIAGLAPDVPVTAQATPGKAARALLAASPEAELVVMGSARAGRQGPRLFIGSTSTSVVALAKCPAIVVGPNVPADGDVVVGVDGSPHSLEALCYAVDSAVRYGAAVRVVSAWFTEVVDGMVATTPGEPAYEAVHARYLERLEHALARHREAHPDLEFKVTVCQGQIAKVLLQAAEGQRLLVIGTRGRGGITGILLGSVSRRILQSATQPVAVLTSGDTTR